MICFTILLEQFIKVNQKNNLKQPWLPQLTFKSPTYEDWSYDSYPMYDLLNS